ncbi:MAG: hypothetical protein R2690_20805 [Acidimicrobiales bacterium]
MQLSWSDEDEAFRRDLRAFLDEHCPPEARRGKDFMGEGVDGVPDWARAWQATLFDHGWMIPAYPPGWADATPRPPRRCCTSKSSPTRASSGRSTSRLRHRQAVAARVRRRGAAGAGTCRHPRRHGLVRRDVQARRRVDLAALATAPSTTATASS